MSRNQSKGHSVPAGSRIKMTLYCNYHKLGISQQHKVIAMTQWRSECEWRVSWAKSKLVQTQSFSRLKKNAFPPIPPSFLPPFPFYAFSFVVYLFVFETRSWSLVGLELTEQPGWPWMCTELSASYLQTWLNLHQSWWIFRNKIFGLCPRFSESAV